ncbi:MAG: flagellar biosynthetic protein FliO [Aureliella sp.]
MGKRTLPLCALGGMLLAAAAAEPTRAQNPPLIHNDQLWTRTPDSAAVIPAQFTSTEPADPRAAALLGAETNSRPGQTLEASPSARANTSASSANAKEPRQLQPRSSQATAPEKRSSGTVQMFVSVGSSLLIVVGLLLGAAWCYRKASPTSTGSLPKQVVQVLGRAPLAPRQQLILVRFAGKLVLVSNLQGEVRTISEIDDPLEVDRVAGLCESSQAGSISDSFRTVLHNIGRTG